MIKSLVSVLIFILLLSSPIFSAQIYWTDWISGTSGANGSAVGQISLPTGIVNVNYAGEIYFAQTSGGTNYWVPSTPYTSAGNAPTYSDIIALNSTTTKTLTFSGAVSELYFAFVSLNSNGYRFNQDFEIIGTGTGYFGTGTVVKSTPSAGIYQLSATGGEPHGIIKFTNITSLSWTSLANETWNGFTVGITGVPEASSIFLLCLGCALLVGWKKIQ